jgi:hypothetical protein
LLAHITLARITKQLMTCSVHAHQLKERVSDYVGDNNEGNVPHLTVVLPCVVTRRQAPLVPHGTPVVNALAKQRAMLENIMRACVGLPPDNNMVSTALTREDTHP